MLTKIITLLLFITYSVIASTTIPNEYWISPVPTGNIVPMGGTIDNPLDGSNNTNFDLNMGLIPANSTIHLLTGTFQTKGSWQGYGLKSGQKVCGSGIDNTIVQLVAPTFVGGSGVSVMGNFGSVTNNEIQDLTIDCNVSNVLDTYSGVGLIGTENSIRRVKVINCGKFGGNSEAWGIVIANYYLPDSIGNIIEECEVSQFRGGGGITSIALAGGGDNFGSNSEPAQTISGIIRNNKVILVSTNYPIYSKGSWFGIGLGGWQHDVLIEGNYLEGCDVGIPGDTGWAHNVIIQNNQILDCDYGVEAIGFDRVNITIANNHVRILSFFNNSTNVGAEPFPPCAFYFYPGTIYTSFTNIWITGNVVEYVAGVSNAIWQGFVAGGAFTGLNVSGNSYDSSMNYNIFTWAPSINVSSHDNTDLFGNPMPGIGNYTFNDGSVSIGGSLTVGGGISGNGINITNLNANNIMNGIIASSLLSGTYSNIVNFSAKNNTFTGTYNGIYSGNGSNIISLNASNISKGILPSFALSGVYSSSVTLSNNQNLFVGKFNGNGSNISSISYNSMVGGLTTNIIISSNQMLVYTNGGLSNIKK
jgi:hypothetical protein